MGITKAAASPVKPALAAKPGLPAKPAGAAATLAASAGVLKESKLSVMTTVLSNGTINGVPAEEATIDVRLFATTPAMAVAGVKLKKNLGNYESVELFISQSVPCYVEDLDSVQSQVNENVMRVLDERLAAFDPSAYGMGGELGESGLAGVVDGEGEAATDESGEGEAAEDGGVTPEYLAGLSHEELIAFVTENAESFEFTPDDYPDEEDLRAMVEAALFGDAPTADAEGTADSGVYTEDELSAASMQELNEVWTAWQMGKFPAFNAKNEAIVKKGVVKKILEKQAAGG